MEIDYNAQFRRAFDAMEKGNGDVFVTGRAGTGKSTLLEYFRSHTQKKIVVLAPTGVAALNVQGQTIHSFFGFSTDVTVESVKKPRKNIKVMQAMEVLVIDEVSMVRADLFDCMDKVLRLTRGKKAVPFGGVRVAMFGDLYQLPPVVASAEERMFFKTRYESPYFFSSDAFRAMKIEMIELTEIYRQSDASFIEILNAVRNNSVSDEHIKRLNRRFHPDFSEIKDDFTLTITTTNAMASEQNRRRLNSLPGFPYRYEAVVSGNFDARSYPTDSVLLLKRGAQVMMINNDRSKRWVNGTLARVERVRKEPGGEDVVEACLSDGKRVDVHSYTWEIFRFSYDPRNRSIVSESTGSFRQYPMMLAWAITIHKSQGKTFDKVAIDIGQGAFAHGQTYVALSRARTLEGIFLKKPLQKKHIFMDFSVVRFLTSFQYNAAHQKMSVGEKEQMLREGAKSRISFLITYLKSNDEKSRRIITPVRIGVMEYGGKDFLGVEADDEKSGERRVFRVDRILDISSCS